MVMIPLHLFSLLFLVFCYFELELELELVLVFLFVLVLVLCFACTVKISHARQRFFQERFF